MTWTFREPPFALPLSLPNALGWVQSSAPVRERALDNRYAYIAGQQALNQLLEKLTGETPPLFPGEGNDSGIAWRRDSLGKPFLKFTGELANWAFQHGIEDSFLHISNTNDGGEHLVLAIYGEKVAGAGVDLVALDRLRAPGKDIAYFERFVMHFMSEEELESFQSELSRWHASGMPSPHFGDFSPFEFALLDRYRVLSAVHFSFMESASKACGTGLKMGVGMGLPTSLPKQSLGCDLTQTSVQLISNAESNRRMDDIGAMSAQLQARCDTKFVLTGVVFERGESH